MDIFYFPDTLAAGACSIVRPEDDACPYADWSAPAGRSGTIVILGHTDRSTGMPVVNEYGMVGFGREIGSPLRNPYLRDSSFFVLASRVSGPDEY